MRVVAPDLDPDFVTQRLGVVPSFAARRGDRRQSGSVEVVQSTGLWSIQLPESPEWRLDDAITTLLARLPSDLSIWNEIAAHASIDLFCGLHLAVWNRGFELPAELLGRLAERSIKLSVDVYCNGSAPDPDAYPAHAADRPGWAGTPGSRGLLVAKQRRH